MISSLCLSMIFSENRFPLFRIMLWPTELGRPENVVLQQLEQDNMASDNHGDPRVAPERKPPKDLHSTTRPHSKAARR